MPQDPVNSRHFDPIIFLLSLTKTFVFTVCIGTYHFLELKFGLLALLTATNNTGNSCKDAAAQAEKKHKTYTQYILYSNAYIVSVHDVQHAERARA